MKLRKDLNIKNDEPNFLAAFVVCEADLLISKMLMISQISVSTGRLSDRLILEPQVKSWPPLKVPEKVPAPLYGLTFFHIIQNLLELLVFSIFLF